MIADSPTDRTPQDPELVDALGLSQRLGMLGSRPIAEVIDQSMSFVSALATEPTHGVGPVLDIGSGGGVPGLVIGWLRPDLELVLVERRATRADHLQRMVLRLNLAATVLTTDLRSLSPTYTARCSAVVARGLGAPATWISEAARLLLISGSVMVTEPPTAELGVEQRAARWPGSLLNSARLQWVDQPDERLAVLRRFT